MLLSEKVSRLELWCQKEKKIGVGVRGSSSAAKCYGLYDKQSSARRVSWVSQSKVHFWLHQKKTFFECKPVLKTQRLVICPSHCYCLWPSLSLALRPKHAVIVGRSQSKTVTVSHSQSQSVIVSHSQSQSVIVSPTVEGDSKKLTCVSQSQSVLRPKGTLKSGLAWVSHSKS